MLRRVKANIPLRSGPAGSPKDWLNGVWTTYGNAYVENPNWKRNAIYVGAGLVSIWTATFLLSARNERRYKLGWRPIPSQRWAAHTLEDDPQYYEKRKEYHATKPSLWSRVGPDPDHH